MKIGKTRNKSGILKVLLGLAVAGALLFASCQGIFDTAEQKSQNDGKGKVIVDLGDAARTVRPNPGYDQIGTNAYQFQYFVYKFIGLAADGKTDLEITETWDQNNLPVATTAFFLPAGTYRLEVSAYSNTETSSGSGTYIVSAKGEFNDNGVKTFPVVGGGELTVKVALTPVATKDSSGVDLLGNLSVSITVPTGAGAGKLAYTFKQYIGNELLDLKTPLTLALNSGTGVYSGTLSGLAPGSYLFTGRINTEDGKYGGFSEAVHIIPYMTTSVVKTFTGVNDLAKVSDPDEAIKILKAELATWIPTAANKAVLASTPVEYLDDTNTIRINYIGTELTRLNPGTFPITLQGGWELATGQTWAVNQTASSITLNLENPKVVAGVDNSSGSAVNIPTKYNVELRPVAQYDVSYGYGAESGTRGVTIAGVTLSETTKGKGIGALGSTDITVNNAAITVNTNYVTPNDTTKIYNFNASSAKYDIVVYETTTEQIDKGFERLRKEIVNRDKDPTVTPWITSAAIAKWDPQEDKDLKPATPDGKFDTVWIYYVASRLPANNQIPIVTPKDDLRWNVASTSFVVADAPTSTDVNNTTNTGNTKQIIFTPYGGETQYYDVVFKPVAEFYLDFAPDTFNDSSITSTDDPRYDPGLNEDSDVPGGKVTIKDSATTNPSNTEVVFEATNKTGRRFVLGTQTITLANVTITIDITTPVIASATGVWGLPSDFDNMYKTPGTTTNDNVAQDQAITLTGTTSREYKVRVYKTLLEQKKIAVAQLASENTASSARWITGTPPTRRELVAVEYTTPLTMSTIPISNLTYVSTSTPVIQLPVDNAPYKTPYTLAAGWTQSVDNTVAAGSGSNTVDTLARGSKRIPIKFTYRGGVEATIYEFNLIAAAEYKITFGQMPIGITPATGSVTVTYFTPGTGTSFTSQPITANTSVNVLIGSGSASTIKVDASTSADANNIIAYPADSTVAKNNSVTIGTSGGIESKAYEFVIYPSKAKQIDVVREALKALDNITSWGPGLTDTVYNLTDNTTGAAKTTFQVVGALDATTNKLGAPPNFLNSPAYGAVSGEGSLVVTHATPDAQGKTTATLTYTVLGAASTPASGDTLTYTFEITTVAKYNVIFLNGPDSAVPTVGSIQILTWAPGATAISTSAVTISSGPSTKVYVGGITNTAGTVISSETGRNVFRVGTSGAIVDGDLLGSDGATAAAGKSPLASVTSQQYDIYVYPTIAAQKEQFVNKMKAISNDKPWMWNAANTRPSTLVTNLTALPIDPISEIQYLTTEPTITKPGDFLYQTEAGAPLAVDYNTGLVLAASGTPDGSYGANKWDLTFTAIGATSTQTQVYSLRTIPVARFDVVFSGTAQGNVQIKPTSATRPTGDLFISPDSPVKTQLYRGLGVTDFSIDEYATNQYTKAIITYGSSQVTLTRPTAGGSENKTNLTTTSQTYTITVVKD